MNRAVSTFLLIGLLPIAGWRCAGGANDKAPDPNPSGSRFQVPRQVNPIIPAPQSQPVNAPMPTITPAPPPSVPAVAAGLNPAHGQPGHRCDIPVGAPLNSPPATQPVVTNQKTAQPVTITQAPASNVKTAPGMNPPHGQPGHRCDIAVGAPLNSAPAVLPAKQEPVQAIPAPVPVQPVPAPARDSSNS